MKILQIGPYPPPLGGWSFHIKKFQHYLSEHGIENQVLNIGAERKRKIEGCISVLGLWDYCRKQIQLLRRGYTLYNHVDGCSFKGLILTIISQLFSLLFLKRSHLSFHAGLDQYCFEPGKPVYTLLAFCCFHLSGKIICNDELVKERIVDFKKAPKHIHAIPCFSKQYLQFEKQLSVEQQNFIAHHRPLLFTYIFFREGYAINGLWEAMHSITEKYPKAGMIVVGSLEGSEQYIEIAKKKGIEGQLYFAGDISHNNFLSLLNEADLYVRTPHTDGVCSSVLESLALGTPVVASYNKMRPSEVLTYERHNDIDLLAKMDDALQKLQDAGDQQRSETTRDTFKEEMDVLLGNDRSPEVVKK